MRLSMVVCLLLASARPGIAREPDPRDGFVYEEDRAGGIAQLRGLPRSSVVVYADIVDARGVHMMLHQPGIVIGPKFVLIYLVHFPTDTIPDIEVRGLDVRGRPFMVHGRMLGEEEELGGLVVVETTEALPAPAVRIVDFWQAEGTRVRTSGIRQHYDKIKMDPAHRYGAYVKFPRTGIIVVSREELNDPRSPGLTLSYVEFPRLKDGRGCEAGEAVYGPKGTLLGVCLGTDSNRAGHARAPYIDGPYIIEFLRKHLDPKDIPIDHWP